MGRRIINIVDWSRDNEKNETTRYKRRKGKHECFAPASNWKLGLMT